MLILDQNKLSSFLGSIASGLRISPFELFLLILFLAGFIALLMYVYNYQKKKALNSRIQYSQDQYDKFVSKFQLNPSEIDLIEKLTRYLHNGDIEKHHLFINQTAFNSCAAKLLNDNEAVPQSSISALRLKLGFTLKDQESIIHSTAELPEHLQLYILQGKVRRFKGILLKITAQSLIVEIGEGKIPPASGSIITVLFQRKNGVFSFKSFVQKINGRTISIAHSEKMKMTQKRKFYRKNISNPLLIRVAGSSEKAVKSNFIDLGGGGASVVNPKKRFRTGDHIELIFYISGEDRISVIGEVIRTSNDNQVIHISFDTIRESLRDRIIGFILSYSSSAKR